MAKKLERHPRAAAGEGRLFTKLLGIRCTDAEHEAFKEKAAAAGVNISVYGHALLFGRGKAEVARVVVTAKPKRKAKRKAKRATAEAAS